MYIVSWFDKSTLKHLRFPFSFFLMPVFLFAVSQAEKVIWPSTLLAFFILHLLIFPASNGYNSYQDRDETSIGGLKNPPRVSINLFYATLLMDMLAIITGLLVSIYFSMFLLIFVLVSRAYSYRGIRLKKYAITGFITVFTFQGAFVYLTAFSAITTFSFEGFFTHNNLVCMAVSSLFIGSIYPLTQIYQHEADKKDGVISISYKLGYTGTFVFSSLMFAVATLFLIYYFNLKHHYMSLILFLLVMLPVVIRFGIWFYKVRMDPVNASFENTMAMNLVTSACMNLYFLLLILNNQISWF